MRTGLSLTMGCLRGLLVLRFVGLAQLATTRGAGRLPSRLVIATIRANLKTFGGLKMIGQTVSHYNLALEYVDGSTLTDRLHQGPLPLDKALQTALEISEALEAAHDKGIVHRDLAWLDRYLRPAG